MALLACLGKGMFLVFFIIEDFFFAIHRSTVKKEIRTIDVGRGKALAMFLDKVLDNSTVGI